MPGWDAIHMSFCHRFYFPDNRHSSRTSLPLSFSAPVTRLSHFVFLQISQMADDASGRENQRASWMKTHHGRQCSRAQSLGDPVGGKSALVSSTIRAVVTVQLSVLVTDGLPGEHCPLSSSCPLTTVSALGLLAWVVLRDALADRRPALGHLS